MSHIWFIYSNEVVSGPFSTDEVRVRINSGQLTGKSFVWWRGQREWLPVSQWEQQLPSILEAANDRSQKAVWYIDVGQAPIGPLTKTELVENLKTQKELARLRIWSVGMPSWVKLFEHHEVMELLGISRREYDRAPLMGSIAVNRSNDSPKGFVLRAGSISVGGVGVGGDHDLRPGDQVAVLIKSPDLPGNLHARGEVAYVTEQGFVGIRFTKLHADTQVVINEYVKRFNYPRRADGQGAA